MAEDMNGGNDTPSKMTVAKQTLTEVIDEFVDSSGKPLVNWGSSCGFGRTTSAPSNNDRVQLPIPQALNERSRTPRTAAQG